MKLAIFAAAALAAPALFAQSATVQTTTMTTTGVAATSSPVSQRPLPGAVIGEAHLVAPMVIASSSGSTAVMGAAAMPVTRYWFNVPSNIGQRNDFQRWQRLM